MVYSLLVLCVQFLLPTIILLLAHVRIYLKLASLPFWGQAKQTVVKEETNMKTQSGKEGETKKDERKHSGRKRSHKTIYLLVCVVVVFMCSWFPLKYRTAKSGIFNREFFKLSLLRVDKGV